MTEYTLPIASQDQAVKLYGSDLRVKLTQSKCNAEPGSDQIMISSALQDLGPDDFARGLITIAHAQIIAEVLISFEFEHATVVIAAPVLCIYSYKHVKRFKVNVYSVCWTVLSCSQQPAARPRI